MHMKNVSVTQRAVSVCQTSDIQYRVTLNLPCQKGLSPVSMSTTICSRSMGQQFSSLQPKHGPATLLSATFCSRSIGQHFSRGFTHPKNLESIKLPVTTCCDACASCLPEELVTLLVTHRPGQVFKLSRGGLPDIISLMQIYLPLLIQ